MSTPITLLKYGAKHTVDISPGPHPTSTAKGYFVNSSNCHFKVKQFL